MLLGTHLHKTAIRDRENGQWGSMSSEVPQEFVSQLLTNQPCDLASEGARNLLQ